MSNKNGMKIWIVLPYCWSSPVNSPPSASGYQAPEVSFTLKSMAEEWVKDETIKKFKNIAYQKNFSGYLTMDGLVNSILWGGGVWRRFLAAKDKKSNYKYDDFLKFIGSKKSPELIEEFLTKWNIDNKNISIDKKDLNKMTDDQIMDFVREMDLQFFTIKSVRVIC